MDVGKCTDIPTLSPIHGGKSNSDFRRALAKEPPERTMQDLEIIFRHLHRANVLHKALKDPTVKEICQRAKYEIHGANDILYCRGEYSNCWYILISGSVFIEGSMFLPNTSFGKRVHGSNRRSNECLVLENSELLVIEYDDTSRHRNQTTNTHGACVGKTICNDGDGRIPSPNFLGPAYHPSHPDNRVSYSRSLTRQKKSTGDPSTAATPNGRCAYVLPAPPTTLHAGCGGRSLPPPPPATNPTYNSLGRPRRRRPQSPTPNPDYYVPPGVAYHCSWYGDSGPPPLPDRHRLADPPNFHPTAAPVRTRVNSESGVGVDGRLATVMNDHTLPNSPKPVGQGAIGPPWLLVSRFSRSPDDNSTHPHPQERFGGDCVDRNQSRPSHHELYGSSSPHPHYGRAGTEDGKGSTFLPTADSFLYPSRSTHYGGRGTQGDVIPYDRCYSMHEETPYDGESLRADPDNSTRPRDPAPDYYSYADDRRSSECEADLRARFMIDLSGLEESLVDSEEEEDDLLIQQRSPVMRRDVTHDDVFYEQSSAVISNPFYLPDANNRLYPSSASQSSKATLKSLLEKDPFDRTPAEIGLMASWLDPDNRNLPADLAALARAFVGDKSSLDFRTAVCSCAILATVPEPRTMVMNRGEQLDSWCVVFEGQVEVATTTLTSDKEASPLTGTAHMTPTTIATTTVLVDGDGFGVEPVLGPQYFCGVMRTLTPWCSFLCVSQDDFVAIARSTALPDPDYDALGSLTTTHTTTNDDDVDRDVDVDVIEEGGTGPTFDNVSPSRRSLPPPGTMTASVGPCSVVVCGTEDGELTSATMIPGTKVPCDVVKRGTPSQLIHHLIDDHGPSDPTYIEDFLLTYRVFVTSPSVICDQLLTWFQEKPVLREKTTRIVLLWVNNHFIDFEKDLAMMDFLENFEALLDCQQMQGQLRLLNMACFAKAKSRTITLTRSTREDILHFSILGGWERGSGIYISKVEPGSKAADLGLKRGDQVLEVNGQNFEYISHTKALDLFRNSTHLSITVKSNLLGFKQLLNSSSNLAGNTTAKWTPKHVVHRKADDSEIIDTSSLHSPYKTLKTDPLPSLSSSSYVVAPASATTSTSALHDLSFRSDTTSGARTGGGGMPLLQSIWHQRKQKLRRALGKMALLTTSHQHREQQHVNNVGQGMDALSSLSFSRQHRTQLPLLYDSCGSIERQVRSSISGTSSTHVHDKPQPSSLSACTTKRSTRHLTEYHTHARIDDRTLPTHPTNGAQGNVNTNNANLGAYSDDGGDDEYDGGSHGASLHLTARDKLQAALAETDSMAVGLVSDSVNTNINRKQQRSMSKLRSSLVVKLGGGGGNKGNETGPSLQALEPSEVPKTSGGAASAQTFSLFRSSFGLGGGQSSSGPSPSSGGPVVQNVAEPRYQQHQYHNHQVGCSTVGRTASYNPFASSSYDYANHHHHAPYYPEHVLKVYKGPRELAFKFLLVHKETSAKEVVMLTLREFGITDSSSRYSLFEVSVENGGVIKRKRLPDQLNNLADRIGLNARYYIKNNFASANVSQCDETSSGRHALTEDNSSASQERTYASDLLSQAQITFDTEGRVSVPLDSLKSFEVAVQLTLRDFDAFSKIESAEYVVDLFGLSSQSRIEPSGPDSQSNNENESNFVARSRRPCPASAAHLHLFEKIIDREMFWVVSEIVNEQRLIQRSKTVKLFVKVAKHCRDLNNFNSAFAVLSGLGHRAVSRLTATWDKLPTKYGRLYEELQRLMDPTRNMASYRAALNKARPPVIPFFPLVKKDLTFIHLGNETYISKEGQRHSFEAELDNATTKSHDDLLGPRLNFAEHGSAPDFLEFDETAVDGESHVDTLFNGTKTGVSTFISLSAEDVAHDKCLYVYGNETAPMSKDQPLKVVNFDKMRMVAREVRSLVDMCSVPFDFRHALDTYGAHSLATNASMMVNWWSSSSFGPASSSTIVPSSQLHLPPKSSCAPKATGAAKSEVNLNFVGTKKLAALGLKADFNTACHHASDPDLFISGGTTTKPLRTALNNDKGLMTPKLDPAVSVTKDGGGQFEANNKSQSTQKTKAKYAIGRRSGIAIDNTIPTFGLSSSALSSTGLSQGLVGQGTSSSLLPPPNPKKMYERALAIRRVRAYLLGALGAASSVREDNTKSASSSEPYQKLVTPGCTVDEDRLMRISYSCEPPINTSNNTLLPPSNCGVVISSSDTLTAGGEVCASYPYQDNGTRHRRPRRNRAHVSPSPDGTDARHCGSKVPPSGTDICDNDTNDRKSVTSHDSGSFGKVSSISGGLLHHFAVTRMGGRKKANVRSMSQTEASSGVQKTYKLPSPNSIPKFGTSSPQAIQKLMALSEGTRCKAVPRRAPAPLPPTFHKHSGQQEDTIAAAHKVVGPPHQPTTSLLPRHGRSNSSDNAHALLHSLVSSTRFLVPQQLTAPPSRRPPTGIGPNSGPVLHLLPQESSSVTSLSWTANQTERTSGIVSTRGQTLPTTTAGLMDEDASDTCGGLRDKFPCTGRFPLKTYSESYGSRIFESIDSGRGSAASSAAALTTFGSDASFHANPNTYNYNRHYNASGAVPNNQAFSSSSLASSGSSLLSGSPSSSSFLREPLRGAVGGKPGSTALANNTGTRRSFSPPSAAGIHYHHHTSSAGHGVSKSNLSPPAPRPISSPDNGVNAYRMDDVTTLTRHKKSNGSQLT